MPPSRKDGPPQASPTSLASSSSAASPSRGKEPPQVETDASWIKTQLNTCDRLLPGCQHMLDSAVSKGQEFILDLLWFRFSAVPLFCPPPPHCYSLLSWLFFVILPDLRLVSSYPNILFF